MEKWWEVYFNNKERVTYVKADDKETAIENVLKRVNKEKYSNFIEKKDIEKIIPSQKVCFDEIVHQFPHCHYTIDVSWDFLEQTLERYIEHYGLEIHPDFQRAHVWNEEQQISYVEYSMRGGLSGREIFLNEPNWQGYAVTKEMVLVDGLQRITAIRKFMKNELKVFGKYFAQDFQYLSMTNCSIKISINNLKTRKEVLEWYLDFNSAGTQHTVEELAKVRKLLKKES